MCGIAGLWDICHAFGAAEGGAAVRRMTRTLAHRGPDDEGYWQEEGIGLMLGHRRLSIVDPSSQGHQPMRSASGRYVIVFNGEVYNFAQLRRELESRGAKFVGHSDTEVMLTAIDHWGLAPAVKRFNGMFAFAIWDREQRTLSLGRDRVGIKPLYYGWTGCAFIFASELNALRACPGFKDQIDRNALALLLQHNYIPAPHSIYERTYKLMPGTILTLPPTLVATPKNANEMEALAETYWGASEVAKTGSENRYGGSPEDATAELDALLRDAVAQRMVADVPLGAFLSGGVDSSTVVALMQAQSTRSVRTFSIGFDEAGYDEAPHAKAVAAHLGTDHTSLYVTSDEARAVIPDLPAMYGEPFSDSSQIPTFLVSKLAREHVTVSLSGDGGDELFGGYDRYFWVRRLWSGIHRLPTPLRTLAAQVLQVSPHAWDQALKLSLKLVPDHLRPKNPNGKAAQLAQLLVMPSSDALYTHMISHWKDPHEVVIGGHESSGIHADPTRQPENYMERMMLSDLVSYLPDDILTKVDRASMAVSLEARVPLLDHRVIEFASRLPLNFKIRDGQGKWPLREVLYKYVPKELIERPKQGFGVPIGEWLRGPLREWAEELLGESRLRQEGFFDPTPIRQKWNEHISGKRDWHYHLWDVLMFQAWYEHGQVQSFDARPCEAERA